MLNSVKEKLLLTPNLLTKTIIWKRLITLTIISVFFYIFMEWVFFVTKPSFMSVMNFAQKVEILLIPGFLFSILSLSLLFILIGFDYLSSLFRSTRFFLFVGALIPAVILSTLSILLIDNFTYIILNFGIVSTAGILRGIYAFLSLILFWMFYRWILRILGFWGKMPNWEKMYTGLFVFSLCILASASFLTITRSRFVVNNEIFDDLETMSVRPNVLILGSDGVNAEHMSAFGYNRDTTPRIKELMETSLVAENAFPNSGNSTGSVVSMLTGKLPVRTRVVRVPQILKGEDAFQHLPGILQRNGYHTVEIGVPEFVDAYVVNMRNGFDIVNQRSSNEEVLVWRFLRKLDHDNVVYFISKMTERIEDRLAHMFFIKIMENPMDAVLQPVNHTSDREMVDQLLNLLLQSDEPLFVHMHLMGTHGPKFNPRQQVFSAGEMQDNKWMTDFYDDAILDFDTYIGEILDTLSDAGILDNTIVIFYSDHGMGYRVNVRLPLIMHFPEGKFAGKIFNNVQNLDIAPTILDFLDLAQPNWMEGRSLLKREQDENRLVYATGSSRDAILNPEQIKPPFYQFGYISILDCQKWYLINLESLEWDSGYIFGHSSPCDVDVLLSIEQVRSELLSHLSTNGFDVSSIPDDVFLVPTK